MSKELESTRQKLEEITSGLGWNGQRNEAQLWEQTSKIENIIGITCTQTLFDGDPNPSLGLEVNCHAYTLGAWRHPNYFRLNSFIERVANGIFAANGALIDTLIQKNVISRTNEPKNGDIVLYFHDNKLRHSGVIRNTSTDPIVIESKWGVLPLFLHDLYHVPANYGQPNFYKRIEDDLIVKLFDAYYAFWQEDIDDFEQGMFGSFGRFLTADDLKQDFSIIVDDAGIAPH